ncbi:MAG: 2Fe-2S iron-sulfur cluster binding domain-containing protein [Granulosicoccus sp.]|nr:2Fe-2S iron-sulfur cluster binding domain-containing protein [Granulosicoccus sp.]
MSFSVNGQQHNTSAHKDTPLLYVLRSELNLKGTRFGCGEGHCGACKVIVDNRVARSCETLISDVHGKSVRTIESLLDGEIHPVVAAIVRHNAWQCGYCIAGIAMQATVLYESSKTYDRQAIAEALNDNFCRCGAHPRILDALADVCSDSSSAPSPHDDQART